MIGLTVHNLRYSYRSVQALAGITATFAPGAITGVLGRNSSGKSTLAMCLAGQLPYRGEVLLDNADGCGRTASIWENPALVPQIALVSEATPLPQGMRIGAVLDLWEDLRPTFDRAYADELLHNWALDPHRKHDRLSRGQKSAFCAVLGLASRAPVTIFDLSLIHI